MATPQRHACVAKSHTSPAPRKGPLARQALSSTWPNTTFRLHTIIGGVSVRWTDGLAYADVHTTLTATGIRRIRMARTHTPQLNAAAVIRAQSARPHAVPETLAALARAIADQADSSLHDNERRLGEVLAAASGATDLRALFNTLNALGLSTLQAVLADPETALRARRTNTLASYEPGSPTPARSRPVLKDPPGLVQPHEYMWRRRQRPTPRGTSNRKSSATRARNPPAPRR